MDIPNFYVELGQKIAEKRKEKKLSQAELADQVNLSRASIANIESGRQQVLAHTLVTIAESLNINLEVLLGSRESVDKKEIGNLKDYDSKTQDWVSKILKK